MATRSRAHTAPEHENEDRWLVTYADMITLLLAFFIMMYASSVLNQSKFESIVRSVRAELRMTSKGAPVTSVPAAAGATGPGLLAGDMARDLEQALGGSMGGNVQVLSGSTTVTVRLLADGYFFHPGSADLEPPLRRTLNELARLLQQMTYHVRIEGHTCDLPTHNERFDSNWELSAQRAANVMSYLSHYKALDPERLVAAGFADTHPALPNISSDARRHNRRVDVVLQDVTSAPRLQPDPASEVRAATGLAGPEPVHLAPLIDVKH
ncbi:MAG TPA: flagellar motor protein MotB [Armatimonadota bacterium]|jgi:chemotaxis protein MotB